MVCHDRPSSITIYCQGPRSNKTADVKKSLIKCHQRHCHIKLLKISIRDVFQILTGTKNTAHSHSPCFCLCLSLTLQDTGRFSLLMTRAPELTVLLLLFWIPGCSDQPSGLNCPSMQNSHTSVLLFSTVLIS